MKWWNPLTWFEKLPTWVKSILNALWDALKNILTTVGQKEIEKIKAKILEVSTMDIDSKEKLKLVFNYTKELLPESKDYAINLLIESLVSILKNSQKI